MVDVKNECPAKVQDIYFLPVEEVLKDYNELQQYSTKTRYCLHLGLKNKTIKIGKVIQIYIMLESGDNTRQHVGQQQKSDINILSRSIHPCFFLPFYKKVNVEGSAVKQS